MSEALLRFGPPQGPLVLIAPALFEEANRTRAFTVSLARRLAERGIASALPDLPGQGESVIPTSDARLNDWREAFAAAARKIERGRPVNAIVSIRAGALVDTLVPVTARWHLSPPTGGEVLKDLRRLQRDVDDAGALPDANLVEIGGNLLSHALLSDLVPATTKPARVVRLDTDPRPADRKIVGAPLWRKAEPTTDSSFSLILADDIADWVGTCGD